jgi:hypothetical protein
MEVYKSVLRRFDSKLWGHHFMVSQEVGDAFSEGNNRRVVCQINGSLKFHCALMPHGEGGYFINMNEENRSNLNLEIGDPLTFTLEKDTSEYGLPMPEELSELLKIDDEANEYFHALTPGKQRNLIYIVSKPKSSATRLNKALGITEFLKHNRGILDFKLMNAFMREFNKI